jgi:hypothetical protein
VNGRKAVETRGTQGGRTKEEELDKHTVFVSNIKNGFPTVWAYAVAFR